MSTPAQIEANRQNSLLSTGPASSEGKARSSQNALTHGIFSRQLLLPNENPQELDLLHDQLVQSYRPADSAEMLFVERIISCEWKIRRLHKLESRLMHSQVSAAQLLKDLETLSRMEQRLDTMLHKAAKELRELQKQRHDREKSTAQNEAKSEPKPSPEQKLSTMASELSASLKRIIASPGVSLTSKSERIIDQARSNAHQELASQH